MLLKQGNTYKLSCTISDIDIEDIAKIVFKFNEIKKVYLPNSEQSDVTYSEGVFTVPLSQQDTLKLIENEKVEYEVAVKFTDEQVKRSRVEETRSLKTIIEEAI